MVETPKRLRSEKSEVPPKCHQPDSLQGRPAQAMATLPAWSTRRSKHHCRAGTRSRRSPLNCYRAGDGTLNVEEQCPPLPDNSMASQNALNCEDSLLVRPRHGKWTPPYLTVMPVQRPGQCRSLPAWPAAGESGNMPWPSSSTGNFCVI